MPTSAWFTFYLGLLYIQSFYVSKGILGRPGSLVLDILSLLSCPCWPVLVFHLSSCPGCSASCPAVLAWIPSKLSSPDWLPCPGCSVMLSFPSCLVQFLLSYSGSLVLDILFLVLFGSLFPAVLKKKLKKKKFQIHLTNNKQNIKPQKFGL
jgi:hypothetical protein